jgi:hypothetical protein
MKKSQTSKAQGFSSLALPLFPLSTMAEAQKSMRISFPLSIVIVLTSALLSLVACKSRDAKNAQTAERASATPQATAQSTPFDGVRRVTLAELQAALDKGEAVVLDVRGTVEYRLGHIKGSRSVPLGLIAQQIKDLPRDKLIVAYCA